MTRPRILPRARRIYYAFAGAAFHLGLRFFTNLARLRAIIAAMPMSIIEAFRASSIGRMIDRRIFSCCTLSYFLATELSH